MKAALFSGIFFLLNFNVHSALLDTSPEPEELVRSLVPILSLADTPVRPCPADTTAPLTQLSSTSFRRIIHSCYRWMTEYEIENFWEKGKIHWNSISIDDHGFLKRGIHNFSQILFCWSDPAGSIRGGLNEEYGSRLIRIDLVSDIKTFDRNTQTHYDENNQAIAPYWDRNRQGVDNELVYANYISSKRQWFQEYMIKEADVIIGWTTRDIELEQTIREQIRQFEHFEFPFASMHFFYSYFSLPGWDNDWPQSGRPYYTMRLKENLNLLTAYWGTHPVNYTKNPLSRGK